MTYEHVRVQAEGGVLEVELHRPDRLNALHAPAHAELAALFDAFEVDATLRVAIITGHGPRAFCSGNDLKWQAAGGAMERPPSGFAGLTLRHTRAKPVIAAVNGVAFGGGCEIVLACDMAVAAENARFAFPEGRRGLVPLAGVHLLPRMIASKPAMAMLLAGKEMTAHDALRIGLVSEVVAEGQAIAAARALARGVVHASPQAVATCMDMARRSLDAPSLTAAMAQDYASLSALRKSADFIEGPKAFAEKREPRWSA